MSGEGKKGALPIPHGRGGKARLVCSVRAIIVRAHGQALVPYS